MIRIPHLETNITSLCQCRCVACNHFVSIDKPWNADVAQVERDLAALAPILHVEAYGMLGGEPTLHKGLVDILRVARASGIADRLEVWTNGMSLRELSLDGFWQAFDVLVVSAYPGKLTDDDLAWIEAKARDEGVRLEIKDERKYPNFTQLLEATATTGQATQDKYRACWFKGYSRVVDRGYFYRCCTTPYIPRLLFGRDDGTDGIAVAGLTEAGLRGFLDQATAPFSCGICAGRNTPAAKAIPWSEIRDPQRWLAASAGVTQ